MIRRLLNVVRSIDWLGIIVPVGAIVSLVYIFDAGWPYLRWGPTICGPDLTFTLHCIPPADCMYVGLEGRRRVIFGDANHCPLFVLLPPRVDLPKAPVRFKLQRIPPDHAVRRETMPPDAG